MTRQVEPLVTRRMRLVPSTVELVRAEIGERARFARLLGAEVPTDWPPEEAKDALPWFLEQLEAAGPSGQGWYGFYGVVVKEHPNAPIVVGGGGSLGPPRGGVAEVGYSVLPAFRRCGYATEMMAAIVDWLCEDPGVALIHAQTANSNVASRALLATLGFAEARRGSEPDTMVFEHECTHAPRARLAGPLPGATAQRERLIDDR